MPQIRSAMKGVAQFFYPPVGVKAAVVHIHHLFALDVETEIGGFLEHRKIRPHGHHRGVGRVILEGIGVLRVGGRLGTVVKIAAQRIDLVRPVIGQN
jgi:hypothetical protein